MSLRTDEELRDVDRSYYRAKSYNEGVWHDPEAVSFDDPRGMTGVEKAALRAKSGNLRDLKNWLRLRGLQV